MIRLADSGDAAAISAIYRPIVEETAISFEYEPLDAAEFARRIEHTLKTMPWLVDERDGRVVGYAYAVPHRARAAYQWTAEVSVYIDASARRQGVARSLYLDLLERLKRQRVHMALAGVTLPNPASVRLHESLGFTPVGVYHEVGYKFDKWHDVGWWELRLDQHTGK